jgi:tripartite-type tricarboxylate transporter receptor subunit TctC
MLRRHFVAGSALAAIAPGIARAQADWPTRPITMVVPYAAGGGADIVAREAGMLLTPRLGQSVVIDNKGGAAGGIGTELVARAKPDGYTFLFAVSSNVVLNPHATPGFRVDTLKELIPVAQVTDYQYVLVVHPDVPANTLAEFIALAKKKPGELTFSSSGAGGSNHLGGELLKSMAGIDMLHVPFKGTGPALFEVMSGRITMNVSSLPPATAQIKAGKLKAIAVTGTRRVSALPDVPTVEEAGLKGYQLVSWHGVFAPAKTPDAVVARLERELVAVRQMPQMKARLDADGLEAAQTDRAAFIALVRKEHAFWGEKLKTLNVKFE